MALQTDASSAARRSGRGALGALSAAGLSRHDLAFQHYLNICYPGQKARLDRHGNYQIELA